MARCMVPWRFIGTAMRVPLTRQVAFLKTSQARKNSDLERKERKTMEEQQKKKHRQNRRTIPAPLVTWPTRPIFSGCGRRAVVAAALRLTTDIEFIYLNSRLGVAKTGLM